MAQESSPLLTVVSRSQDAAKPLSYSQNGEIDPKLFKKRTKQIHKPVTKDEPKVEATVFDGSSNSQDMTSFSTPAFAQTGSEISILALKAEKTELITVKAEKNDKRRTRKRKPPFSADMLHELVQSDAEEEPPSDKFPVKLTKKEIQKRIKAEKKEYQAKRKAEKKGRIEALPSEVKKQIIVDKQTYEAKLASEKEIANGQVICRSGDTLPVNPNRCKDKRKIKLREKIARGLQARKTPPCDMTRLDLSGFFPTLNDLPKLSEGLVPNRAPIDERDGSLCKSCFEDFGLVIYIKSLRDHDEHRRTKHFDWHCYICSKEHKSRNSRVKCTERHKRDQIGKKYYCAVCLEAFCLIDEYEQHFEQQENLGCFQKCPREGCSEKVRDLYEMAYHMRSCENMRSTGQRSFLQIPAIREWEDMTDAQRNSWESILAQLRVHQSVSLDVNQRTEHQIMTILLLVDGVAEGKLEVKRFYLLERIFAVITNYELAGNDNRELAWLINEAKSRLIPQRVPELFVKVDSLAEPFMRSLRFYSVDDETVEATIDADTDHEREGLLMSVVLSNYFKDRPPVLQIKDDLEDYPQAREVQSTIDRWQRENMLEILEKELCLRMNQTILTAENQTSDKDSERTPQSILDWIANQLLISCSNLWDVCPYDPQWTSGRSYDCFAENWTGAFNWVNPPFSRGQQALLKALIEFIKGRSSVLLLPLASVESKLAVSLVNQVAEIKAAGPIIFDGYDKALPNHLSFVFLIHPTHLRYTKSKKDQYWSNPRPNKESLHSQRRFLDTVITEKKNIALRLLDQSVPVIKINELVNLHLKDIRELRDKELSRFRELQSKGE